MNMKKLFKNLILSAVSVLALATFSACDDPIDISLDQGPKRLVVDGWLYQNVTTPTTFPDTIHLKWTSAYFDASASPKATGAFVTISDNTGLVDTLFEVVPGKYITQKTVREIGRNYKLTIRAEGQTYEAFTTMKPCPLIDSVVAKEITRGRNRPGADSGFNLFYYGPENPMKGDFYRFKTYVNGQLLNKASDLAFTDDKSLKERVYIDSLQINFRPFDRHDLIRVETLSITEDFFYFCAEAQAQINNGGLFAQPPANVRTNVKNTNPKGPPAVGYFGASGLSWAETVCK